jgi:hypothetical protein
VTVLFGGVLLVAPLVSRTKMKPEVAAVADDVALALGVAFATRCDRVVRETARAGADRADDSVIAIPVLANPLRAHPASAARRSRSSASRAASEARHEVIGVEAYRVDVVICGADRSSAKTGAS